MKSNIFFIVLSVLLIGCQFSCQNPVKTAELPVIDISKKYPTKEIHLQNVADIEYVALETTDDVLLSGMCVLVYLSDKYLVIQDYTQSCIFVFDRNGKIITHLSQRGPGDKEYNSVAGVVFDEKNEEIFIVDIPLQCRILVYSLTGEYKRTLKYDEDLRLTVYNFDDENLLVYDENGLMTPDDSYREKPYLLLSKKDGSIVADLDIHLPVRYLRRAVISFTDASGQQMQTSMNVAMTNNRYFGQDFVISDMSADTIYKLTKNRELTPLIVRTPSVHTSDPRIVWSVDLTTDKFIIVSTTTLDFDAIRRSMQSQNQAGFSLPSSGFMYEFATGETSEISFVNDDYPSGRTRLNGLANPQKKYGSQFDPTAHLKNCFRGKAIER